MSFTSEPVINEDVDEPVCCATHLARSGWKLNLVRRGSHVMFRCIGKADSMLECTVAADCGTHDGTLRFTAAGDIVGHCSWVPKDDDKKSQRLLKKPCTISRDKQNIVTRAKQLISATAAVAE